VIAYNTWRRYAKGAQRGVTLAIAIARTRKQQTTTINNSVHDLPKKDIDGTANVYKQPAIKINKKPLVSTVRTPCGRVQLLGNRLSST
jgi:hypothetical protein